MYIILKKEYDILIITWDWGSAISSIMDELGIDYLCPTNIVHLHLLFTIIVSYNLWFCVVTSRHLAAVLNARS